MSEITPPTIAGRFALIRPLLASSLVIRLQHKLHRQLARRRTIRVALLLSNVVVLAIIVAVVLANPRSSEAVVEPAALDNANTQITSAANPLDQLSSANIALTVARMDSLPETTAVANQAESETADLAIISNTDNVLTKPQVVATALKSRADIQRYVSQSGDTLSTLASKFGVTSDSIRWSNGVTGNTINPGTKLYIPPVNGIVYIVKTGDTPASLAQKFSANEQQIIAYNDAEINGLYPGEDVIIPNGTQTAPATAASITSGAGAGVAWGSAPIYGSNGYDYGFCTWYVATQVSVPANWGNASSWAYYARQDGWNVSSAPTVGAIAQTALAAGGEGHVAIVDAVSPDGSQIKFRDMNGIAGWGRVGYSGWVSASTYQNYITH